MLLTLIRQKHTRWGVDGKLFIDGKPFADTTEHPTVHLSEGIYTLTSKCMLFRRGNGPMLNTDGRICVGELCCPGCVIKTRETFTILHDRIRKVLSRGKPVTLTIKCFLIALLLTNCSSLHRVAVVAEATHDTLYLSNVQYDSIYVFQDHLIDRSSDTVVIREVLRENRYKLLRDTVRVVHVDSIPVIHTVEVVKTEKYVPKLYKWSLAICIIIFCAFCVFCVLKIKRATRAFVSKKHVLL